MVADLVPLSERGTYLGIISAVWAVAAAIGPIVGGSLASAGAWVCIYAVLEHQTNKVHSAGYFSKCEPTVLSC